MVTGRSRSVRDIELAALSCQNSSPRRGERATCAAGVAVVVAVTVGDVPTGPEADGLVPACGDRFRLMATAAATVRAIARPAASAVPAITPARLRLGCVG